tara:strand:+ start:307 stop:531 length:225 start_codon:yes stop_codon:yes gene_type:complete
MAKLTQGATICHVYLSYKMWYTWQVAGVGAGYIEKDILSCDNLSHASRAWSFLISARPPRAWCLALEAWSFPRL